MDFLLIIRNLLNDRLGLEHDRILPESTLNELGVDSMMLLELLFELEDKSGMTLTKEVPAPKTIGDLVAFASQLQPAPPSE
jgi:acyl carrier protein